ncbi:thyroglobulin-like, partial [Eucyclogobius newberryi]|uniref:thyroglobulin-like n=1 Tax=Eucyclogobius newberryi TaxID=166745 RepID=UPI003B590279
MSLVWVLFSLFSAPAWTTPSEYQLEEARPCEKLRDSGSSPGLHCSVDGHFSSVQCAEGHCWCVDVEGQELSGSRTNNSAPHCLSRCQLQSSLRCSSSGHYETVQCDSSRGQCWCVDTDGMEIYGTRQRGRPGTCPGPCQVVSRGLLHTSSPRSSPHLSPQCSDEGHFLPVQCKSINSTNEREVDLSSAFS